MHRHPKPILSENTASEPGVLTVLADMVKGGALLAVIGAATGAVATLLLGSNAGIAGFFENAIADSAALGAVIGAAVGVPAGCAAGVNEIRDYYHTIAMPKMAEAEFVKGKVAGAELEQAAVAHEQESKRFRELIAQQKTSVSLATMEPMGRA